jgi:NAD(P)-dependent dehydrogenase (short-subunit alcohol dehydrogenase family)
MGQKLITALGGGDIHDRDAQSPFGYVAEPDDIASAVAFLCSEDGRYITNERITVSGGGF